MLTWQHCLFWRRRSAQTTTAGGDEKEAVKGYFNTVGFERWNKIYGTTDEISSVSHTPVLQDIYTHSSKIG